MRLKIRYFNRVNLFNSVLNHVGIRSFSCLIITKNQSSKSKILLSTIRNSKPFLCFKLLHQSNENTNNSISQEPSKQLTVNNDQQTNSKNNSSKKKTPETSPIRKLLKIKDFADLIYLSFLFTGLYIGYKNYKKKQENDQKFDLEWLNVPMLKHKMFKCNEFFFPEFIAKVLSEIKNFQTRKDDVWVNF
jgi:hypothetical protein